MPVRIIHKDTHKEYIINIKEWNTKTVKDNYLLLQISDTGELYHFVMGAPNDFIDIVEYTEYLQLANLSPDAYVYSPLPDVDNTVGIKLTSDTNSKKVFKKIQNGVLVDLPLNTPNIIQSAPHQTKSHVGIGLKRKSFIVTDSMFKNDYFKFIIIGIVVGLTVAYFVFIFKWNK